MDLNLSPSEEAFRREFEEWLRVNLPDEWKERRLRGQAEARALEARRAWERTLGEGGWLGVSWPSQICSDLGESPPRSAGMPVILRDSAGNRYLYGLDLISVSDNTNKKFYYHTAGLGSTTAITDSTGAVKKTYQYDASGAIRVQTGTQPNEFTFTGEQVDSSGLQYLRARFYDNATGRFLIRDPLPLLHRYPYAQNNPVNYVDPYGLCGICDWANDNIVKPVRDTVQDAGDCINHNFDCLAPVVDLLQSNCGQFVLGSASFLVSVENPELMLIGATSGLLNFELNAPRHAKEGDWFQAGFSTGSFLGNFAKPLTGSPLIGVGGFIVSGANTLVAGARCGRAIF